MAAPRGRRKPSEARESKLFGGEFVNKISSKIQINPTNYYEVAYNKIMTSCRSKIQKKKM